MNIHYFVYPFISSWTYRLFSLWTIMNNDAMNILIQVFEWMYIFIFLEHIPISRISRSYGNYV